MQLKRAIPFYMTRKNADGEIASYSQSAWITIYAVMLACLSVIAWSLVGFMEIVRIVIGWAS